MTNYIRAALTALFAIAALGATGNAPLWTARVDSRTSSQWVAAGPDRLYVAANQHIVSIDVATGKRVWMSHATASSGPAYASGVVAIPHGNSVELLDARDGKVLRRVGTAGEAIVTGAGTAVVIVDSGSGVWTAFGKAAHLKWRRQLAFGRYGVQVYSLAAPAVAALYAGRMLVVDGATGAAVAQTDGVDDIIGSDGRYLWLSVVGGGIKGLDLDTNRSFVMHANIVSGAARVEHGIAVAVIGGRLKSIDLTRRQPSVETLKIVGRWIGGPIAGKLFVERSDGLYLQGVRPGSQAVKVAAYKGDSRIVSSDREMGYVGLHDGTLLAVNAQSETLVARIATSCTFFEGFTASGGTAVVHCDAGGDSQLVAFPRLTGQDDGKPHVVLNELHSIRLSKDSISQVIRAVFEASAVDKRASLLYARLQGFLILYYGDAKHVDGFIPCNPEATHNSCYQAYAVIGDPNLYYYPEPANKRGMGPISTGAAGTDNPLSSIDRLTRSVYREYGLRGVWSAPDRAFPSDP